MKIWPVLLVVGISKVESRDCTGKHSYHGRHDHTQGGLKCQSWNKDFPHAVKIKPDDYINGHNFCRNPDGDEKGPWCYTVGNKRWDYCDINECKCNDPCVEGKGETYNGVISKTASGYTCQRWDSRHPHAPKVSPDPSDHNYCRNPDGDDKGPWCYTTNSNVRWEYCSQIPRCSSSNPGCGPKPATTTQPSISRTTRPRPTWVPTSMTTTSTTITLPSKQCGKNANVLELGARQYKLTKMDSEGSILGRDNYFESMTGRYGRRRRDLSENNDDTIVENSFSESFDIPEMDVLERSLRDVDRKQYYKDYVGKDMPHQVRIVGGDTSGRGTITHQVGIRDSTSKFKVFCGGSIINEQWIVSAAHCTDRMRSRQLLITAGHLQNEYEEAKREKYFQESDVEAIVEHRQWKRSDVTSDIVMLKLKTPLTLNDYVQKICLPPPEFKADRKVVKSDQTKSPVCLITGWGHTEGSGNNANLQQATVPILTNKHCNELLGNGMLPDERNLCAGLLTGGRDTCQGDSGGPLTCHVDGHWTLVGVVSWGIGCADKNSPGAYTRVTKFTKWIDNVVEKCENHNSGNCKIYAFQKKIR